MKSLKYKLSAILIILAMFITSVAGFGVNAQADEVSPMALADYDPVDVAVINNIILTTTLSAILLTTLTTGILYMVCRSPQKSRKTVS